MTPFWNPRRQITSTIYACQAAAVVGVFLLWDPLWLLATAVGVFLFVSIGLECGMHRQFAHKSYSVSRPTQIFMAVCGIFALQGPVVMWSAFHVTHHRYADKDGDPHPATNGWKSWFWVDVYSTATVNHATVRRLMKDPVLRVIQQYYLRIYLTTLLVATLVDPRITVYFFLLPAMWSFHASGFVTVILHRFGYRNFETPDESRNSRLAALLVGSPFHNNHHANPGRYNDAVKPGEFDLHGVIIHRILKWL